MTLKLLSYNIQRGGTGREAEIAAVILEAAPDVVILQEATRPHVVERLAAETGMADWGARPGHSLAFMARRKVESHDWHKPSGARHPFVELVPAGTELRIFGLHLSAVHSNWTEWRRMRELRATLRSIERHQDGLHVLAGDFNTLAPGELLDTRLLPPRLRALVWLGGGRVRYETIKIMLDARYLDTFRALHPLDEGFTFPTWSPHVRLDFVFLPERFADCLKDCQVVTAPTAVTKASDHFPLLARIKVG
ncbi:MAG TPA: endonuclease/exonuclease/phosphatase family protein [Pyrinomonadaceae bacterium]|nr:endonuclease/exonuclease/phosphatase family protein [Pyrinomonadaceae bacterium]